MREFAMDELGANEIHDVVRRHYGEIAERALAGESAACCSVEGDADCCASNSLYEIDVSELPENVSSGSLGCGDPITLAELQPGQTVLDLGSGAGMDCFLAARRVGPRGRVIGVDMTETMIIRADKNRETLGLENVAFRLGQIEDLPVDDRSIDVVISNCVINLSPDKKTVFREAYRVLRPGGRLAMSDMVTQGHFSEADRADAAAWAACVSGAEDVADYVAAMRLAGFEDISVRDKAAPQVELAETVSLHDKPRLFSARVVARKPTDASGLELE
jgi:SAM-dependent methyltransferase